MKPSDDAKKIFKNPFRHWGVIFLILVIVLCSQGLSAHTTSGQQSKEARLTITGTVPVVCQVDNEMTDTTDNKMTLSVRRWCNAPHTIHVSASVNDAPVDGLVLQLEGKKIKEVDGEWTLYSRSPPSISTETLVIHIPKTLRDVSGISLNVTIDTDM